MKKNIFSNGKASFLLLSWAVILFLTADITGCGNNHDDRNDSQAISEKKLQEIVDTALSTATHKAGISVALLKNGKTLWTYAAGCSDCKEDSPVSMTTETPAFVYSITKTFMSALILTQIENGLYTLTDTVDGLLAGDSGYDALSPEQKALLNTNASVAQLLTHTSGMKNYADNLSALIPMCDPAYDWQPYDILTDVVFEPFDSNDIGVYQYSNTNYVLLGIIAQVKGGGPLNALLADTFFTPLDIKAILSPQDTYPSDIAHPYDDASILGVGLPDGSFLDFSVGIAFLNPFYDVYTGIGRGTWAAGGMVTTAKNIAVWGYELYDENGGAISSISRETLKGSATINDEYGYGLTYKDFTYNNGAIGAIYRHGGSAPGYKSLLAYEDVKGISVAILTNVNDTANDSGLVELDTLAEALLNASTDDN